MEGRNGIVLSLFDGNKFISDVSIFPNSSNLPFGYQNELRISTFSAPSDRCLPQVVLHTISDQGVLFKLEPAQHSNNLRELEMMHTTLLKEAKTAVVSVSRNLEIHLVAMNSRSKPYPCFWGFVSSPGLYSSCLTMLNLRCLALVLDLDETLIVANTLRSFEDRIMALGSKLKGETDPQKLSGMSAELRRYIQDRALLRQYADDDRVWDNASEQYVNAEIEVVGSSTQGGAPLMRPVVRLQDSNMVFTRINPQVKDTSVLVRLRPSWEELRDYLTAKGRKRFEVFVCTMAEREYALEIWRLLDPQGQLIKDTEFSKRIVCVKSGLKKSLANVFSSGNCHPSMAMVIDDRLKVWEDKDQAQVHVVPAFAPYYAPQAEIDIPMPILCLARNVACDVRGGFFRDFDEVLLKEMSELDYYADVSHLPSPPIVSNYLIPEEERRTPTELSNGSKGTVVGHGHVDNNGLVQITNTTPSQISGPMDMFSSAQSYPVALPTTTLPQDRVVNDNSNIPYQADIPRHRPILPEMFSSKLPQERAMVREREFDRDPDEKSRLLILQHGEGREKFMDSPESANATLYPRTLPRPLTDSWMDNSSIYGSSKLMNADESSHEVLRNTFREAYPVVENHRAEPGFPFHHGANAVATDPIITLQELARKYNSDVEYKSLLNTTKDLQFSVEVFFGGKKVGEGTGRSKKEAQYRAADSALQYMTDSLPAGSPYSHLVQDLNANRQGRVMDPYDESIARLKTRGPRYFAALNPLIVDEGMPPPGASEPYQPVASQQRFDMNWDHDPVTALKEYCDYERMSVSFNDMSPSLASLEFQIQGFICQVEVGGRVMGRGNGFVWEDAKKQAAEDALKRLRPVQFPEVPARRMPPRRSPPLHANKRMRTGDFPRRSAVPPHGFPQRRYFNR